MDHAKDAGELDEKLAAAGLDCEQVARLDCEQVARSGHIVRPCVEVTHLGENHHIGDQSDIIHPVGRTSNRLVRPVVEVIHHAECHQIGAQNPGRPEKPAENERRDCDEPQHLETLKDVAAVRAEKEACDE